MGKVTSAISRIAVVAGVIFSLGAHAACFDPKALAASGALVSGYDMPVGEETDLTEFIAIGKVVALRQIPIPDDPEGYPDELYTVQIERVLKGHLPSRIRLYASFSESRYFMKMGERHILFLKREWGGSRNGADYYIDDCGNSSTLPKGNSIVKQVEAALQLKRVSPKSQSQPPRKTGERK